MTTDRDDLYRQVQADLAAWHSVHPRATFAEIEAAVEEQVSQLRAQLIEERTTAGFREEQPLCEKCGTTMQPRARSRRTVILRGDEQLELERSYVVCPRCGAGLFPPG